MEQVRCEHRAIVEAIAARDPAAARRAAIAHLQRGEARLHEGGVVAPRRRPRAALAAVAARVRRKNERPPMPTPILGVVADDFTGATDVASMLVRAGHAHRAGDRRARGAGAGTPTPSWWRCKSRTTPAAEAVRESLAALALAARGGRATVLLQILLDLRLHAPGQHRPGRPRR